MAEQPEEIYKLTNRQRLFIENYLQVWNASEAARLSGYRGDSTVQGSRLIANVGIRAEIDKRLSEMTLSANEVLGKLSEQANANISKFFDFNSNGTVKGINSEYLKAHGYLVKKMKVKTEEIELELYDGQNALVQIGRYHKLFTDKVDIEGKDGGAIVFDVNITKKDDTA